MIDKELIHQAAEDIDIFQADLTEEYERLRKPQPRKLRLWPLAVAACIAGFVAIFLVPPREANMEPEKQPVVAQQTEKPEKPVVKEEPAEAIVAVETPTKPKRAHRRRPVVQQETAEDTGVDAEDIGPEIGHPQPQQRIEAEVQRGAEAADQAVENQLAKARPER